MNVGSAEGQGAAQTAGQGERLAARLRRIPLWRAVPAWPGRPAHQPSAAYRLAREDCVVRSPHGRTADGCRPLRRHPPPVAIPVFNGRSLPCAGTAAPRRGGSARFRPFRAWAGTCTLPSRDATPRSGGKDLPAERRNGPMGRQLRDCERMTTCPCENFPQGGTRPRRTGGAGGRLEVRR